MVKWGGGSGKIRWALGVLVAILFWGCAHHQPLPSEKYQWAYRPVSVNESENDVARWAPIIVIYGHQQSYNRIGRPRVVSTANGGHKIVIDTRTPTFYYMRRTFKTDQATYTNLIYRVHFPKIPFSLIPFNLSTGKNVGLMVVVTLDTRHRPVLVTTVHTCGCYKSIVGTRYLPKSAFPQDRPAKKVKVYGEHLPAILNYNLTGNPRLLLHLRPGVHRVMDLEVRDEHLVFDSPRFHLVAAALAPMADLTRLPVNGKETSLFHTSGAMAGYVKGSVKPLESMFMSLISLDFFVGTDKVYADPAVTGNYFYTSLKPWRRKQSDMWDFAGFLHYWGWRL